VLSYVTRTAGDRGPVLPREPGAARDGPGLAAGGL